MPEYLSPIVYKKAEMRLGRVEGMENLVRRFGAVSGLWGITSI